MAKMFDYRILQVHGTTAWILPLCEDAAEYLDGTYECAACWVTVDFLTDARAAGFTFC
jgi:hypothetical protein